jgi:glycosyltransferase involved in cell wall biosynthesis
MGELAEYRLLIVNHAVEIGGAEYVLLKLLDALDPALFEPALACPFDGPFTEEARRRSIPVFLGHPSRRLLAIQQKSLGRPRLAIAAYPFDMAGSVARLARLVRAGSFDLVLTNSAKADVYGSLAARLAGRPVAWKLNDIVDTDTFSRLNVWLLKTAARHLARTVITDSRAAEDAMASLGVPRRKLVTIYNGIDPEVAAMSGDRESVRREFGIDQDVPVAGFVGRLVAWKGPDRFIEAAAKVAARVPGSRFILVGDAVFGEQGYVDELKGLAVSAGLADRIVFTGFRDDTSRIIGALDVLVHASTLPDALPTVLIEAMAVSCPVVASAAGGVPEMVVDGVTGILVPPKDTDAMAEAMVEMMSNNERRASMGKAGHARVIEHFSLADSTRATEQALLGALRPTRGN